MNFYFFGIYFNSVFNYQPLQCWFAKILQILFVACCWVIWGIWAGVIWGTPHITIFMISSLFTRISSLICYFYFIMSLLYTALLSFQMPRNYAKLRYNTEPRVNICSDPHLIFLKCFYYLCYCFINTILFYNNYFCCPCYI